MFSMPVLISAASVAISSTAGGELDVLGRH
jgi:hypothetical protein